MAPFTFTKCNIPVALPLYLLVKVMLIPVQSAALLMIKPSYVTQHFSDLLKKYRLRHIRFHDLRHTFASILIGQDVPLINMSNFLGHSDLSTTANIYAHIDKASKQDSADVITEILNKSKN